MRLATLTLLLATLTALAVSGGPQPCRSKQFIKRIGIHVLCELEKGHRGLHQKRTPGYGLTKWDGKGNARTVGEGRK